MSGKLNKSKRGAGEYSERGLQTEYQSANQRLVNKYLKSGCFRKRKSVSLLNELKSVIIDSVKKDEDLEFVLECWP